MRNLFNKLEMRIGKFAIKNLMRYIIVLYILGFVIMTVDPSLYIKYFSLNVHAIMNGQVWRVITFIIQPTTTSFFFIIFSLYLYYMLGTILEKVWGAFKFNVYYFSGVIFTVLAAFVIYWVTGNSFYGISTYYINMSLFLAFATVMPDTPVMFMFIIPMKMRWLAILDVGYLVYEFVVGTTATRISIVVSLINFAIYFFIFMKDSGNRFKQNFEERKRQKEYFNSYNQGRQDGNTDYNQNSSYGAGFGAQEEQRRADTANRTNMRYNGRAGFRHKCAVCGRTDLDNDELEFRFCSRCNGNFEYCNDHLFTHQHVK